MHSVLGNFTVARLFEHKYALLLVCSNNLNRHLLVTPSFSFCVCVSRTPINAYTHRDYLFHWSVHVELVRFCVCVFDARHADFKYKSRPSLPLPVAWRLFFDPFNICPKQAFLHLIRCSFVFDSFFPFLYSHIHVCSLIFSITTSLLLDLKHPKRYSVFQRTLPIFYVFAENSFFLSFYSNSCPCSFSHSRPSRSYFSTFFRSNFSAHLEVVCLGCVHCQTWPIESRLSRNYSFDG